MDPLKKDSRWNGWPNADEEYFRELVESLAFRPEVPDAIVKQYEMVKSVLRFCYYDYELTFVVFLLLGIAFEAALKIKYEQSEGSLGKGKRIDLKNLIDWGLQHDLFEEDSVSLHAFREIRNIHAHQKEPVIFGITGLQSIYLTTDIINGLFDPRIELRRARLLRTARLNRIFNLASQSGMVLTWKNTQLLVFTARLLVYNNLHASSEYHIAIWPIFEIDLDGNQVEEGNPIMVSCNAVTFRRKPERGIIFSDGSSLSPIVNPIDKDKFSQWKQQFNSGKFPLAHVVHFRLAEIRHELMSKYIYSPHRLRRTIDRRIPE